MQSGTAPSWPEPQDSRPLVPLLIPSCAPLIYDSFCVAWTHFPKLGSLCQNSSNKQIRPNTGKSTIHIHVRLKPNNPSSQHDSYWHHMKTLSDQQQNTCLLSPPLLILFTVFVQFHRRNIFITKMKRSGWNHDITVVYFLVEVEVKIVPFSMKDCAETDRSVVPEVVLWFPVTLLPLVVHLRASEATLVFLETVISFSCASR